METILFEEIFQKIRINFLFNHPFLSVLALSIPTEFKENKNSLFESDGFSIDIDLEKIKTYSTEEITYLYAHTLLHIILKHPQRKRHRDRFIWNLSSDLVVNLILSKFENVGVKPVDEIVDIEFESKSVEEVYELLYKESEEGKESSEKEAKERFNYSNSKLDLKESSLDDNRNEEELDSIITQALSIAKKSSREYASLLVEIDSLIKPEVDIEDTLREYLITSLFEKTQSYSKPNRRFISSGLYLAGNINSKELVELYIALDSSSSITVSEYQRFLGVIKEICEEFYEYRVTLIPFNSKVELNLVREFNSFDTPLDSEFHIPKSEGGTDFNKILRYLKESLGVRDDSLLLVLSDGEFEILESLASETLFLINSKKNLEKFKKYGRIIEFL